MAPSVAGVATSCNSCVSCSKTDAQGSQILADSICKFFKLEYLFPRISNSNCFCFDFHFNEMFHGHEMNGLKKGVRGCLDLC